MFLESVTAAHILNHCLALCVQPFIHLFTSHFVFVTSHSVNNSLSPVVERICVLLCFPWSLYASHCEQQFVSCWGTSLCVRLLSGVSSVHVIIRDSAVMLWNNFLHLTSFICSFQSAQVTIVLGTMPLGVEQLLCIYIPLVGWFCVVNQFYQQSVYRHGVLNFFLSFVWQGNTWSFISWIKGILFCMVLRKH